MIALIEPLPVVQCDGDKIYTGRKGTSKQSSAIGVRRVGDIEVLDFGVCSVGDMAVGVLYLNSDRQALDQELRPKSDANFELPAVFVPSPLGPNFADARLSPGNWGDGKTRKRLASKVSIPLRPKGWR